MIQETNRIEFDSLGVDQVRARVTHGVWSEAKLREAREWVDEQEHGEERAFRRVTSRTARSAKNAAWAAATAAIIAAIAAVVAVIFSPGPRALLSWIAALLSSR